MTATPGPRLIRLEEFSDERGSVHHYGTTELDCVKRVYFISPSMSAGFRGWHGHKFESKTFRCIRGSFMVSSVKVLDWEKPAGDKPVSHELKASEGSLLIVPAGFANGMVALEENSQVMVMSNKSLQESLGDDFRLDPKYFAL